MKTMSTAVPTDDRTANEVLGALTRAEYSRVALHLQSVVTGHGDVLHQAGDIVQALYFPASTLVGLLVGTSEGECVEVGIIGNEGVVGISVFWGVSTTPHTAMVVLPGKAFRAPMSALSDMLDDPSGVLHDVLLRYTHAMVLHISQTAACNRLHPLAGRLARWLLVSHDRARLNVFPLTQEFLATILGVRRATITEAMQELSSLGALRYVRGRIEIMDRENLEVAACDCYEIVRQSLREYLKSVTRADGQAGAMTRRDYDERGDGVDGTIKTSLPGYVKRPQR